VRVDEPSGGSSRTSGLPSPMHFRMYIAEEGLEFVRTWDGRLRRADCCPNGGSCRSPPSQAMDARKEGGLEGIVVFIRGESLW